MMDEDILSLPEVKEITKSPGVAYFSKHIAESFRAGMEYEMPEFVPCQICGHVPMVVVHMHGNCVEMADVECTYCHQSPIVSMTGANAVRSASNKWNFINTEYE